MSLFLNLFYHIVCVMQSYFSTILHNNSGELSTAREGSTPEAMLKSHVINEFLLSVRDVPDNSIVIML